MSERADEWFWFCGDERFFAEIQLNEGAHDVQAASCAGCDARKAN
jgi:hypothetical protein